MMYKKEAVKDNLPNVETEDCNVMIDQSVKNNQVTFKNIRKIED